VDETGSPRHLSDLKAIFQTLPQLDPTDSSFADDVLEAVRAQPPIFPFDTTVARIYARIWASLAKPEDLLSIPAIAEWPLWLPRSPGGHIAPCSRS